MVLIIAFIGLNIHANSGGLYESKTMVAMVLRIMVTLVFSALSYFFITKGQKHVI